MHHRSPDPCDTQRANPRASSAGVALIPLPPDRRIRVEEERRAGPQAAPFKRKLIGERTREAMRQIAREGRGRSGRLPFGYRTEANPTSVRAVAGDRSRLVEHAEALQEKTVALVLSGRGDKDVEEIASFDG